MCCLEGIRLTIKLNRWFIIQNRRHRNIHSLLSLAEMQIMQEKIYKSSHFLRDFLHAEISYSKPFVRQSFKPGELSFWRKKEHIILEKKALGKGIKIFFHTKTTIRLTE